jgi:cysteinyl-tRNA synthetase, unknown class
MRFFIPNKTLSRKRILLRQICVGVFAFFAFVALPALAQQQPNQRQGRVRIQGRDVDEAPRQRQGPSNAAILDYRDQMRLFVQSISTFSRKYKSDFVIIPMNGMELLAKVDALDETKASPARAYMRSIDGVLQESMFYGHPKLGMARNEAGRENLLRHADRAVANGLKVMVLDYARAPNKIDEFYRLSASRDYIPYAAPDIGAGLSAIASYPDYPHDENPNSTISLNAIRNFLYLQNSAAYGRQDEFSLKIHATNYDMIIVDVFHGRKPLTKQAVETLKYKKLGSQRLVLATMDIGSAASYRYYWKNHWQEGSPRWIKSPHLGDPDSHYVEYWNLEWQRVITGDTQSYVYGIIDLGFDGVVLTGLDSYRFFEGTIGTGEDEEDLQ